MTRRSIIRITETAVIQAASDITDEKGLNNVSLRVVVERLNTRTPSLYNHIKNLDGLLCEVAHNGMRIMNQRVAQATIGKSDDAAIKAVAIEYLDHIIEHCGIYETTQWVTWHDINETVKIFCGYTDFLKTLIPSCHPGTENVSEILDLFTGFLRRYTILQLRYASFDPQKVRTELAIALDTVLADIHYKCNSG